MTKLTRKLAEDNGNPSLEEIVKATETEAACFEAKTAEVVARLGADLEDDRRRSRERYAKAIEALSCTRRESEASCPIAGGLEHPELKPLKAQRPCPKRQRACRVKKKVAGHRHIKPLRRRG
jgi:hypothetical protein